MRHRSSRSPNRRGDRQSERRGRSGSAKRSRSSIRCKDDRAALKADEGLDERNPVDQRVENRRRRHRSPSPKDLRGHNRGYRPPRSLSREKRRPEEPREQRRYRLGKPSYDLRRESGRRDPLSDERNYRNRDGRNGRNYRRDDERDYRNNEDRNYRRDDERDYRNNEDYRRDESRRNDDRNQRSDIRRQDAKNNKRASSSSSGEDDFTEEQLMAKLVGIAQFDTSKGKNHTASDLSGVNKKTKRKYRQYMNRRGGFNRPLSPVL